MTTEENVIKKGIDNSKKLQELRDLSNSIGGATAPQDENLKVYAKFSEQSQLEFTTFKFGKTDVTQSRLEGIEVQTIEANDNKEKTDFSASSLKLGKSATLSIADALQSNADGVYLQVNVLPVDEEQERNRPIYYWQFTGIVMPENKGKNKGQNKEKPKTVNSSNA